MKINKYILGAGALLCMMLPAASAQAQDVKLKCMEWNIKSFEYDDNSNAVYFEIAEAMEKIKAENPDIVCFNEFETATGRMSSVEKLTECAQSLGMFPFFVFSYNKDNGAYGNGILSKYPIVNSASVLLGMYTGADQRSAGWADILVPTDSKPEGVKVRIVCSHLDAFGGKNGVLSGLHYKKQNLLMIGTVKNDLLGALQSAAANTNEAIQVREIVKGPAYTIFMLADSRFWGYVDVASTSLGNGIEAYGIHVMW